MANIAPRHAVASLLLAGAGLAACSGGDPSTVSDLNAGSYNDLNLAAGSLILYELQVRTANACDPDSGSAEQKAACKAKVAPKVTYQAEGMTCGNLDALQKIRLGTLDDLKEPTKDFRKGITLAYVKDMVGANAVWLMPLFPNNDRWAIPDACDNLGSPYAVRDYLHASGRLSRACIQKGRDEYSSTPCWANAELDAVIADAHQRGLRVMLDVAFNHFGHNYLMYDYVDFTPIRERTAQGENLDNLWSFDQTYEESLLHPKILDTSSALTSLAKTGAQKASLAALKAKCPGLAGDELVRAFATWRVAFDWERASFVCKDGYLEAAAPGFYLGKNKINPSTSLNDKFTNDWHDVKFLFHHEENTAHFWELARVREYLFRVLNYWVSRGVDGFRFDHTTDYDGGMGSNEWKYLTSKVDYYAYKRGQKTPVYLAEEFSDQMEMNKVVDIMTEGYVGDMCGRDGKTKDTAHVQGVIDNMGRFHDRAFVMTALETHDEKRLVDGTGFTMWTGAGFWGIGAAQRSTPMLLAGQELGESYGLGFKRSDYLRSRFVGNANYQAPDALVAYYRSFASARLDPANAALLSSSYAYLTSRFTNQADSRIFAQVKWTKDLNVVFVFHNLWEQDVSQSFFVSPDLGKTLGIKDDLTYRLTDVTSGAAAVSCRKGADLKYSLDIQMASHTRAEWLRLERCP
jgi:hypothetical protein